MLQCSALLFREALSPPMRDRLDKSPINTTVAYRDSLKQSSCGNRYACASPLLYEEEGEDNNNLRPSGRRFQVAKCCVWRCASRRFRELKWNISFKNVNGRV